MVNVKDLINIVDEDKYKNYEFIDKNSLGPWTVDYHLIAKSQFIVYRTEEDNYIDFLQVGRDKSSNSKKLLIKYPQFSDIFGQMDKDLQIVDGSLINDEIKNLTNEKRLSVDKSNSNSQNLVLNIYKDPQEDEKKEDTEHTKEEELNESND